MGSCASVVRKKEMQSNTMNKQNIPYAPYSSKNENNYQKKTGIQMKAMSTYNTNPTYNGTPRYT